VRSVEIGPLELLDWSIRIAEALAATEEPDAPLVAGSWCDWCPAAAVCPENTRRSLAVAQADFEDLSEKRVNLPAPERLSREDLGVVLDGLPLLEAWAEAVRKYAYAEAEAGHTIPGHKLVNKVARRKWRDETEAAGRLVGDLFLGEDAYTAPKLKSPAQIEKLLGKKHFAERLADLAPAVSSGTTLVPNSDRRPAVTLAIEGEFDDLTE
jgi:hypothetical protein